MWLACILLQDHLLPAERQYLAETWISFAQRPPNIIQTSLYQQGKLKKQFMWLKQCAYCAALQV